MVAETTGLPDRHGFGSQVHPDDPGHRSVAALRVHLARIRHDAPLAARLDSLVRIGRWVIDGPSPPGDPDEPHPLARLRLLVRALDRFPDIRARLAACAGSVLQETSGLGLFAEAALPHDRGLLPHVGELVARRVLPSVPDHGSLEELLGRIFVHARDADWLEAVPLELLHELGALLGDIWQPVTDAMSDSIALLCTRVSALGLSEDVRSRSAPGPVRESPFFRLPRAPIAELPALIVECRRACRVVHDKLETQGVSVKVVYCLDTIERALDRVELMQPLALAGGDRLPPTRALLAHIARAPSAEHSIVQVLRTNMRLLARKIIERAGHTGEHYVTATRREYWHMLASAAGGGALTAFTTLVKFLTKWGYFPLFVDGMLSAANYAASFIVMQLLGFTLATKQPSMTAATLAGAIRDKRTGDGRLDELVAMIARISRSQFAAAVGNIVVVIPFAIAINLLWMLGGGGHFLDEASAAKTIDSFHPFGSGTIFFAALTGVLLWLSSLGAGWVDNWSVYHRIPEGIAHHPLGRVVGRTRMQRLGEAFGRNVAGFGGNLTLGLLLGMTPVMGVFFGLPIDVRHVTLSTGSLTFAACSLGFDVIYLAAFQWACLGIVLIGLLNFGVSFALALAVAFRAREVDRGERLHLAGAVARRFLRSPLQFFIPPKDEPTR